MHTDTIFTVITFKNKRLQILSEISAASECELCGSNFDASTADSK